MSGRTLGSLTADDLGSRVRFTDGGASYDGNLGTVEHSNHSGKAPTTMIVLRNGEWRHVKSYPAATACDVVPTPVTDQEQRP